MLLELETQKGLSTVHSGTSALLVLNEYKVNALKLVHNQTHAPTRPKITIWLINAKVSPRHY